MSDDRQPIGHQTRPSGLGRHSPHEDDSLGAVEGERPSDPQRGNPNAPALDDQGLPADREKIDQDVEGANLDETEG